MTSQAFFSEGAKEEPPVMEKQQPAKASLQFHCGELQKKKEKKRYCQGGKVKTCLGRLLYLWSLD